MAQVANNTVYDDNHVDDHVDTEIQQYLSSDPPKSFFLFAGAGSGKTRSLIHALEYLDREKGAYLAERGKQVAVITYTNAACDEICRRLQYKSIFHVSTIHSFLWELIKWFQADIKNWVQRNLESEIQALQGKKGKADAKIAVKENRFQKLKDIKRFTYNPNGDNLGIDSLSHDEVIKMGSEFITAEPTIQEILVQKYPVLLIDESQDTKKELVDAILRVYEKYKNVWTIGMFGDTMQRIYMDGKDRLESVIPTDWAFPIKIMNHRSAKRIVTLANAIRKTVDSKEQRPRSDAKKGAVRLFISDSNTNKEIAEMRAAKTMSALTADPGWDNSADYQSLILEHHMAAKRYAFQQLFSPLDATKEFSTALRKGEIAELSFLANTIAPLVKAYQADDCFEISKLLRKSSPLLNRSLFEESPGKQQELLQRAEEASTSLFSLWDNGAVPSCLDILKNIRASGLYELGGRTEDLLADNYEGNNSKVIALRAALQVPFDELLRYSDYISEQTKFTTHQGVKGLEFPRVMVILDDSDAKGNLFCYEKLFGVKAPSPTDLKNESEGKDTSILRTARLFYVACTRAKDSLAVVVYSEKPVLVKNAAVLKGWFAEEEIVMM